MTAYIKCKNGQSIYDLCLMAYGTLDLLVRFCNDNGVTDANAIPVLSQYAYDTELVKYQGGKDEYATLYTPPSTCSVITGLTCSSVGTSDLTFTWDTTLRGTYEYAFNTTGEEPESWIPTTSNTRVLSGLTGGVTYFFYVRSVCALGVYSERLRDQQTTTPITCDIPSGVHVEENTEDHVRIEWDAPVTPGQKYKWVLSTVEATPSYDFSTGTVVEADDMALSFNIPADIAPDTTYYFYIRSRCSATDYSLWTQIDFTTLP